MKQHMLNEFTRTGIIVVTILAVVVMALLKDVPEARGALIAALSAAIGWEFRGRVETPEK